MIAFAVFLFSNTLLGVTEEKACRLSESARPVKQMQKQSSPLTMSDSKNNPDSDPKGIPNNDAGESAGPGPKKWTEDQPNGDTITYYDCDNDGNPERCEVRDKDRKLKEEWRDPDDDGDWDDHYTDTDGDQIIDESEHDMTGDGFFDTGGTIIKNEEGKTTDARLDPINPPKPVAGPKPRSDQPEKKETIHPEECDDFTDSLKRVFGADLVMEMEIFWKKNINESYYRNLFNIQPKKPKNQQGNERTEKTPEGDTATYRDKDGDGWPEECEVTDGSTGKSETWIDKDEDGDWDAVIEEDEDGRHGKFDLDGDGKFDYEFIETKIDEKKTHVESKPMDSPEPVQGPPPRRLPRKKIPKSVRFNFGLKGGWSHWPLGDFALSKESFENFYEDLGHEVFFKEFQGSLFGGIDLCLDFNLANSHIVGLSTGFNYFPGGLYKQDLFTEVAVSEESFDLSSYAIPFELYYKIPAGNNFFVKLAAGIDCYRAAIKYDLTMTSGSKTYFWRGTFKDSGTGGHISLGGEISLSKTLALTFAGEYSFVIVKLDDFTGEIRDHDGNMKKKLLTMSRDEYGSEFLGHYSTTTPLPGSVRPAEIDLSGLRFSIGIRIFLGSKNK